MYRLLKVASVQVNGSSLPIIQLNRTALFPCSLCNRDAILSDKSYITKKILSRNLSTSQLIALRAIARKRKKYYKRLKKKYTELVEINEDRSKITKAVVKNLTPHQVTKLTEQPDLASEYPAQHQVSKSTKQPDIVLKNPTQHQASKLTEQPNLELKNPTQHQVSKLIEQPDLTFASNPSQHITSRLLTPPGSSLNCFQNFSRPVITSSAVPSSISENQSLRSQENSMLLNINPFPSNFDFIEEEIAKDLEWEFVRKDEELIENIPEMIVSNNDPIKSKPDHLSSENVKKMKSKIKTSKQSADLKGMQKDKAAKESEKKFIIEKFNSNLTSYIDLCVHCDYLNIGFGTLSRYSNKYTKERILQIRCPRPFNSLMHGYAKKGNIDKVLELLRMMKSIGVSPTAQSYAAAFETLGRLPEDENSTAKLAFLHNEMKSKNFDFQNLFEHCTYVGDQREQVLKAVRRLDPDFVPHYHPPMFHYNCGLINELNKASNKKYHSPCKGIVNDEQMEKYVAEQLEIELSSSVKIKSIMALSNPSQEIKEYRAKWNQLEDMWRMSVREALQRDMEIMKMQQNITKSCYSINIYPYLRALTNEQLVDIILHEIRRLVQGSETFSPNLKLLQKHLGQQVRLKYQVKHRQLHDIMAKMEKVYRKYCKWYLNPDLNPDSLNTRQQWQSLLHSHVSEGPSLNNEEELWPPGIIEELGKFLFNIIIKDIKMDVNYFKSNSTPEYLPAFYSLYRYQGRSLYEELKPHPLLVRLFKETVTEDLFFDVNLLPMVSPPVPWITPKSGGYIIAKADFIRLHYGISSKAIEETAPQRLYPVFDSLNQLASIPWQINEPVLDVVLEIFRKGGSAKLNIPQNMSTFVPTDLPYDVNDKNLNLRQRMLISRRKAEMFGLWCEALYRLSLANHFRKRVFWLPHNIDFRGRVYPVPPHLTHLGNDMARSLLIFAKGEKLGPKGLNWLKIHCINLTGLKKREPVSERLRYADEILPDILDSAEKPLTGKMWWAESEEQWQTLACCMEIKKALDSGDPENYVSYFPVHQDGSCNGLQHYAALGRDQSGAESVNLVPNDTPQDVYSCVVNLVEQQRIKDAAEGSEIAKALEGFIKRKVIKQTIMTTVYGVTRYGARLQIAKQLKDLEEFPKNSVWSAATYLTFKTFQCLQEMFTSTREIQNWFTECAKFISSTCGRNVEWQTPLGLPIVQPYSKTKVTQLLNDKNGQLNKISLDVILKPNAVKQKNAFPPNFIHSLDSSHMMLTSLFCEREGITFVSVHDCFWTHPSTVDAMNKICREQFVVLHSEPILENLSSFLMKKYSNSYSYEPELYCEPPHEIFKRVPQKGDFDLHSVLKSTYFFG